MHSRDIHLRMIGVSESRRLDISTRISTFFLAAMVLLCQTAAAKGERAPLGARDNYAAAAAAGKMPPAIVIGFVGGFIRHDDPVHDEVQLAARLRKAYPSGVDVETFENYRGENARKKILSLLDADHDGTLTTARNRMRASSCTAIAGALRKPSPWPANWKGMASLCSSPFKWIASPSFTKTMRSSPRTWPKPRISTSRTASSTARPKSGPPIQRAQKSSEIFDSTTKRALMPATNIPGTTASW